MGTISLVLSIEISPFPASLPDELGCSIVYVVFFPNFRQSNCTTREKIDFSSRSMSIWCLVLGWYVSVCDRYKLYFQFLLQSADSANSSFLVRIDCLSYLDVYDWSLMYRADSTIVQVSRKHKLVVSSIAKNALRMHADIFCQRELNLFSPRVARAVPRRLFSALAGP